MKSPFIIDLHCDLLSYLQMKEGRTPYDKHSRTSHAQMQAGQLRLQVLAIWALTKPGSVQVGEGQVALYKQLLHSYAHRYRPFTGILTDEVIHVLPAVENASSLAEEGEPMEEVLARWDRVVSEIGPFVYMSLTWNGENRFGGGVGSESGLKEDGKLAIEWLAEKGIAIDLSHASDRLAREIFDFIDRKGLKIAVMASHSNFRDVIGDLRNLPDDLVREIIRRKGLIGLNLFAPFVGEIEQLFSHAEYAMKMGGLESLCFGADFFNEGDFPMIQQRYPNKTFFLQELSDASAYPWILEEVKGRLGWKEAELRALAHENVLKFLID